MGRALAHSRPFIEPYHFAKFRNVAVRSLTSHYTFHRDLRMAGRETSFASGDFQWHIKTEPSGDTVLPDGQAVYYGQIRKFTPEFASIEVPQVNLLMPQAHLVRGDCPWFAELLVMYEND